jgi:hypothetical protein
MEFTKEIRAVLFFLINLYYWLWRHLEEIFFFLQQINELRLAWKIIWEEIFINLDADVNEWSNKHNYMLILYIISILY